MRAWDAIRWSIVAACAATITPALVLTPVWAQSTSSAYPDDAVARAEAQDALDEQRRATLAAADAAANRESIRQYQAATAAARGSDDLIAASRRFSDQGAAANECYRQYEAVPRAERTDRDVQVAVECFATSARPIATSVIQTSPPQSGEVLAPAVDERAGLRCLNENRAAVELPPLSLQEFREGRAAGNIATPENLCGRDYIGNSSQQANASLAAEPDTPPDFAAANEHFAKAAAWGGLQDGINLVGFLILAALLYFIPAIIAFRRRHHYRWPIFAFNLGAAWTGLGWIGTLVWALWPAQSAIIDPIIGDATGSDRR